MRQNRLAAEVHSAARPLAGFRGRKGAEEGKEERENGMRDEGR